MVAAISCPDRLRKFVMGGSHIVTGGDRYLMANRPSEGNRATRQTLDDPSRDNIWQSLRAHIHDESPVTDELVHPPHAQLVTRVRRGAPAIRESTARLHTRSRRH